MEKKKHSFGLASSKKSLKNTKGVILQTRNDKDNSICLVLSAEEESQDSIKLIPPALNVYGSKKPDPNFQLRLNPMNVPQESSNGNFTSPFSQISKPSISLLDTGGANSIRKKGNLL